MLELIASLLLLVCVLGEVIRGVVSLPLQQRPNLFYVLGFFGYSTQAPCCGDVAAQGIAVLVGTAFSIQIGSETHSG